VLDEPGTEVACSGVAGGAQGRASQALNGSNWAWLHAAQVLDKPIVCRVFIRLGCAAQVLDEPGLLTPTQSTRLTLGGSGAKAQSSCCG